MPNWREIGVANYKAGKYLLDSDQPEMYRSSVSRFYYAAFSIVTEALAGQFNTADGQETPSHKGLTGAIKRNLPSFSEANRREIAAIIRRLYASRIDADYHRITIDKRMAQDARRDAVALFRALGVPYGD